MEAIADGKPRLLDFGVTNEQAWEVGLACGGKVQVFVERGRMKARRSSTRSQPTRAAKRPVALATDLRSGQQLPDLSPTSTRASCASTSTWSRRRATR